MLSAPVSTEAGAVCLARRPAVPDYPARQGLPAGLTCFFPGTGFEGRLAEMLVFVCIAKPGCKVGVFPGVW
jgi:hypothetical protein